jgi:Cu-Zn family superoxide dismutase
MSVKAVCVLTGPVTGTLFFEQKASGGATTVTGTITGLHSGQATMHVHQYGDVTNGIESIGALYNPFGKKYNAGGP